MERRCLITVLILLLPGLLFVAQAAAQDPAPPKPGVIRGIVTREGTTEPISGAQVTLQGGAVNLQAMQILLNTAASQGIVVTPTPGATPTETLQALSNAAAARGFPLSMANLQSQLASLSGKTPPTTTTDRDGSFTFTEVAPGAYTVRAQKDGYFGKPEGGANPPTAAVDVSVGAGETREANVPMIAGGIIGGRVFDAKGQLMSNATVQAYTVAYAFGRAMLAPLVSKVTDDHGEYRLFWVPPGDYYVAAMPRPATPTPGVPAAASTIKTFYPGVSDIALARLVRVGGGDELQGMDIGMQDVRTFKVSGQVNSLIPAPPNQLGAPNVNAAVLMLVNSNQVAPDDAGGRQVGVVPLLPSSGQFEISNVLPGSYDLFARVTDPSAQVAGGLPLAWGRTHFEVRDNDVAGLSIVVSPSVEVKGTVVTNGDAPIPGSLRVQLLPDDASIRIPAYRLLIARSARVAPDGTFSLPAVPEGHYRVMTVAGLPADLYVADVRKNAMSVFDSGFDLGPGAQDPIQVLLASGSGTVNGIVEDAKTNVVSGATVVLVPETASQNSMLYLAATSDATGQFAIHGVPPGDYKLFAWESIPAFAYQNAAFLANYDARGKPVHVGQSGTVRAELTAISAVEKK